MALLVKESKTWRVDTEKEAMNKIQECKDSAASEGYMVSKNGYTYKTKKSKGEIVEEWYLVDVTFVYEV